MAEAYLIKSGSYWLFKQVTWLQTRESYETTAVYGCVRTTVGLTRERFFSIVFKVHSTTDFYDHVVWTELLTFMFT